MPTIFTTTRFVEAPSETVWTVLSDVARWPEWTPTVKSVRRFDDGPLQVGSRAEVEQPRLPRAVWQVTHLDAGTGFTWEAHGPGLTTIGRHEVVPEGAGCRVTLGIEQRGPMGAVAALVWRRLTQRYIDLEAASLSARVTGAPAA